MDEKEFIQRVEAAGPAEFRDILRNLDRDQERALRVHLGDARFERMRNLALERSAERGPGQPKFGNAVILHGIMGGELSEGGDKVWMSIFRIILGGFERLGMNAAGASLNKIRATGFLKKYYGEQLLHMENDWNVHAFCYDWRLDVRTLADQLFEQINEWFGDGSPVHLVAHSMGGLVSRMFIKRHPERWQSMAPGKLVMLGTPNHGSFAIPILYNGLDGTIKILATADTQHNMRGLLEIAKNFIGTYQMLPSPLRLPAAQPLYSPATYGDLDPPPGRFSDALKMHQELADVIDPQRMIYVAGYNQRTAKGIADIKKLNSFDGYVFTEHMGDGTVPHVLGLLEGVPTYYVDELHGKLPVNERVLKALNGLLLEGKAPETLLYHGLAPDMQDEVRGVDDAAQQRLRREQEAAVAAQQERVRQLREQVASRGPMTATIVTPEESELADQLFASFGLSQPPAAAPAEAPGVTAPAIVTGVRAAEKGAPGGIRVRVVHGRIEDAGQDSKIVFTPPEIPVDAISVGHYVGVKPVYAELALDTEISRAYLCKDDAVPAEGDLLLTQFTERGILRGELGQPFFLPDPRDGGVGRVVAVAGMGVAGRFGAPELTVLARELCWSLGRLGKRHLATVLIGGGKGNLPVADAVYAWMRGAQRAGESKEDAARRLQVLTFVEYYEDRVEELKAAVERARTRLAEDGFEIDLVDKPAATPARARRPRTEALVATRLTVELQRGVYRFGAITNEAAMPERDVAVDPRLVMEVNDLLAAERNPQRQSERGAFLLKLLIPKELQADLTGNAPIVLSCDSNVAQIHWELMSQPRLSESRGPDEQENFLGLERGFTRQLRTAFAPPPEPPPPPNRVLRVLIVADTASDAPLAGARAEGRTLMQVFEKLNQTGGERGNRVEVVALLGPAQANRADVLELLVSHPPFDVMHYAGHCVYDKQSPDRSGWIFSNGTVLSANELSRIDRVPKFVFSNACESGVTPSRSELRSPELAPSFAEAFFARGVSNFICTAWPVSDTAASTFASTLYEHLLGLKGNPQPIHAALREARLSIKDTPDGAHTWGAYQHYGNPFFQLFR